jgi:hypothetical protein
MASRCVLGMLTSRSEGLGLGFAVAIKFANAARFKSGDGLGDARTPASIKLVAVLFATVAKIGAGDGDWPGLELTRGVSSRAIVPASTAASAGAWKELRLMTPPRGVTVGVGVIGDMLGLGLGVGVTPYATVVNKSSSPASGLLIEEKLSVRNG